MTLQIIMVGPFPPPVYGMSSTNAEVYEQLRKHGAKIYVINLAAVSLDRSIIKRLGRLTKVVSGLIHIVSIRKLSNVRLYISISGGLGQIYDIAYILLCRLRGMQVYIRHCSFAYLNSINYITYLLLKIAGPSALHITQCKKMAKQLQDLYDVKNIMSISNAILYKYKMFRPSINRKKLSTIGFISNISAEKGVFVYLDLMAAIKAEGFPIRGLLAGPFQDLNIETMVMLRLKSLGNVEYIGPKYGAEKNDFYAAIDTLIFPTCYKNETEAKVNHEAMSMAVPVITYGRGCIPEVVSEECGKVIDPSEPFVPAALEQLKIWLSDSKTFEYASRAANRRFKEIYEENEEIWEKLLHELVGG